MLKKGLIIAFIAVATLSLSSCKDGPDGQLLLSFDWVYTPGYSDDNPDVPSTISSNTDYAIQAGTYNYTYGGNSSCSTYHWGTYTLSDIDVTAGEKGTVPFVEGTAGNDSRWQIYLWCFSAPDLNPNSAAEYGTKGSKELGVVGQDETRAVAAATFPTQDNPFVIEEIRGNKKMVIKVWTK